MRTQKYWLTLLSFVLGCLLLLVNGVGFFIGPVESSLKTSKPVTNFDNRTLSWKEANTQLSRLSNRNFSADEKAKGLFELISKFYIHTPFHYNIKPWDNWILWLGGNILDEKYLWSQNPDLLWERGGGFCNQAAMIFASKGKDLGLKTRLIALSGHVVAEVYLPNKGWRVVDPDMGVFWENDLDAFGRDPSEDQIRRKLSTLGFPEKFSRHFSRVYASQENNSRVEFPTAPKRFILEQVSNWLKWLIPFGLVGFCLASRSGRNNPTSKI